MTIKMNGKEYPWWAVAVGTIVIVGLIFGLMCLEAWVVMLLWNYAIVSAIMICNPISFWIAFWLTIAFDVVSGRAMRVIVECIKKGE